VVERPVALRAEALEGVLVEADAALLADGLGAIAAEGVDDDHVVAPGQAVEAAGQVQLLVERVDHHRDLRTGRGRTGGGGDGAAVLVAHEDPGA
jgi:hypothetical protein